MPRFLLPIEDEEGSSTMQCPTCRGQGKVFDPADVDDWKVLEMTGREPVCPNCGGTGSVPDPAGSFR